MCSRALLSPQISNMDQINTSSQLAGLEIDILNISETAIIKIRNSTILYNTQNTLLLCFE